VALVRNPETGQLEDDGTPAVDPALGVASPELASAAPPPEPAPAAPAPELATPDATTAAEAPDEVLPPPNPAVPVVPGAQPGLGVAQQTLTAPTVTTTRKIVTPDMAAADTRVTAATKAEQDALAEERKNALEAARLKGNELRLEATRKEQEARDAKAAMEDAQRRRAEVEAQATRDQTAYQAEASRNRAGFWQDPKEGAGNTASKLLWGLSLMFGAGAVRYGQPSAGAQLLDKTLDDWKGDRQRELDRLGKQAAQSGGRLAEFWQQYGQEYQAKKALKDAAGYAQVASEIRQNVTDRQNLLTAEAKTDALKKAADLEAKAAADRQRVVDARVGSQEVKQGGQVTTLKVPTVPKGKQAAADKDRAETLLDLDGKVVGKALTPTEGAKIRAGHASTNALIDSINDLRAFTAKHGTTNLSPSLNQERDILVGRTTGYLTQAYQTGTLQDAEFKRYSGILGGKWYQSGEGAAKALGLIENGARSGYTRQLNSQGVKAPGSSPAPAEGVRQTRRIGGQLVSGRLLPNGSFAAD
jgi:hypothetical protein